MRGIVLVAALSCFAPALARDLSMEERVRAQAAIDRVYYSHQIGASRSFEAAVPRAVLEKKVKAYLQQSVALAELWKTPVTSEMLRRELQRMLQSSRRPERLRELFQALGDDPVLIQECLVRPALVSRLANHFFTLDQNIQAGARQGAGELDAKRAGDYVAPPGERKGAPDAAHLEERVSSVSKPGPSRIAFSQWWDLNQNRFDPAGVATLPEDSVVPTLLSDWNPSAPTCSQDNTWDNGSLDDVPDPKKKFVAVWTGSLMIVWGGRPASDCCNDYMDSGGRYDPATDTWASTSRINALSPRENPSAVWTGSQLIIWGGGGPLGTEKNTGSRYDPLTDTWSPVSTVGAPSSRDHTAIWTGSRMVVWGGLYGEQGGSYDPSTNTWQTIASSGNPRYGHTAVWTGTQMLIWGGSGGGGQRYVPASNLWYTISNYPNAPGAGPAVWTGSRMIVLQDDGIDAGGSYNPITDQWSPINRSGAPSLGRDGATAVWTGSEVIYWGGDSLNSGGRYNPATDTWTLTSLTNAPAARWYHAAVWTGGLMLVWGGYAWDEAPDTKVGGRYDPGSDSWTPMSMGDAPAARTAFSAVWTGTQMIVWGGGDYPTSFSNGFRYDPTLDTWSPISSIAAVPSPYGKALWTGERMLIWGSSFSTGYSDPGASYDPIADTWAPISTAGAPSGRSFHAAVWTGSRMVVWGGSNASGQLNTGGRYDPVSDSWMPVTTVGAPTATSSPVAVFTGSEMIIWRSGPVPQTGGRYNPVTDHWTPTSRVNEPPNNGRPAVWTGTEMLVYPGGRYRPATDEWLPIAQPGFYVQASGHTAVWTGSRMIVWGGGWAGGDYDSTYDTGGIYDPATNSWSPTSTINAASARSGHAAVWTGTEMLIWGGYGGYNFVPSLNSGGRFIFGLSTDDDLDLFTECGGDCNDADAAIHPGAAETCNGVDDDCSSSIDEGGDALCGDGDACTTDSCGGASGCSHPIRDQDGDAHPDAVCGGDDCNDASGVVWQQPAEVGQLSVAPTSPTGLSWDSLALQAGPATVHDLVSGSLGPITSINFSLAACLQSSTATSYPDARANPPAGGAYWYLTRGRNSCGVGTYGNPPRDSAIPLCP